MADPIRQGPGVISEQRGHEENYWHAREVEAGAEEVIIIITTPDTTKMHLRVHPRDEEKDPQDEEEPEVKMEKAKVKVLIMDSS